MIIQARDDWIGLVAAEGVRSWKICIYLLMNSLWGVRCRDVLVGSTE